MHDDIQTQDLFTGAITIVENPNIPSNFWEMDFDIATKILRKSPFFERLSPEERIRLAHEYIKSCREAEIIH